MTLYAAMRGQNTGQDSLTLMGTERERLSLNALEHLEHRASLTLTVAFLADTGLTEASQGPEISLQPAVRVARPPVTLYRGIGDLF